MPRKGSSSGRTKGNAKPVARRGEKVRVRETDKTIPVRPPRASKEHHVPATSPAVDRRQQIVSDDEPAGRTVSG
jgi:hypothetical protein